MTRIRRKKRDVPAVTMADTTLETLNRSLHGWDDTQPVRRAKTPEDHAANDREKDFESVWWSCWHYLTEHLGADVWRTDEDGTEEQVSFYHASLFYNWALRRAYYLGTLQFRLSEIGMNHSDMLKASNLKDGKAWRDAEKTLTRTLPRPLVKIVDKSRTKDDYTVTLLLPPVPGKRKRLSDATVAHGHVSAVHPNLHWLDHGAAIDKRIGDTE
jgi:hypothetical protein